MVTASALAAPAAKPIVWRETACPCCGADRSVPVVEAPDRAAVEHPLWFAVVRCLECELHYTNPRPDEASLAGFYDAAYAPHRKRTDPRRRSRSLSPVDALRGRATERRRLQWHGEGRLLDFGCGSGTYLARLADQGWKVVGLDNSAAAVDIVRHKLGLPVYLGTLPHPALRPASFDVVTMWHSLEHVQEPLETLAEAYKLLHPGGRLVVAVPNIRSWAFRRFGPAWFGLDLPRHLTHFCPASLKRMLELAGFRVEALKCVKHTRWLRSSAILAAKSDQRGLASRLLRNRGMARIASALCQLFRQSDCILAVAERPK